ncbi:Phospho-N-acetylmuramoyl-pentapeptide-transferase [Lachnospiraceae bacterium YSD2013]|nr:Phospho-N-acetylmuramoyl-pentapeptide-transferase [Lachnospiraceae bacterium YSD2013]
MKSTILIASLAAFLLSIVLGPVILPILRRIKAGQTVRDDGPQTHLKKNGTPVMGAFIYLISAAIVMAFCVKDYPEILPIFLLTIAFGVIGFIDDFLKVVLKRADGLRVWQKLVLQLIAAGAFCFYMTKSDSWSFDAFVPFMGESTVNFGVLAIPVTIFIIVGTVNGSNFTDGVDGLETTVTSAIMTFFLVTAIGLKSEVAVLPAIFLGALLGFLMFNVNKAMVFMGDTGSLALGALVAGLAIKLHLQLYLPIFALIYFVEVLSVIIQVTYFKLTHGKRIFRMTPIHHHFELGGWTEAKVVAVFATVTAVLCAVSLLFIPTIAF